MRGTITLVYYAFARELYATRTFRLNRVNRMSEYDWYGKVCGQYRQAYQVT